MKTIFNISLVFFFLTSCSYFVGKIDSPLVEESEYLKNIPQTPTYCQTGNKVNLQLVSTNDNSQKVYLSLIEKHGEKFDLLDHLALWSLLQFAVRPDQSSPTSRLQILVHLNEKTHYFDFLSEQGLIQYPYLYGLEWILKKFQKKRSLEFYARILDTSLGQKIKIGKDLENFLIANQALIKNNQELAPYYFRGNEVLKENESSPTLNFGKVISDYRKLQNKQKITINSSLLQFVTEQGNSGSCNYDFNLYGNSIFLIDKIIPAANLFGLSISAGAFMASSSQKLDSMISLNGLPLFKGESQVRSSAVCVIENEKNKIWAISNLSRDPGQHLFHLVRYGLPRMETTQGVDRLLRHSRHLFLSEPVRLIIESNRSGPDQIENLLKLNLPIYNGNKIGNIWAYAHFNGDSRFIIDDRNPGAFLCK